MIMPIDNPDPKKYKIKKLRGGEYILVDRAIIRWRKANKKNPSRVLKPKGPKKNRQPEAKLSEDDKLLLTDMFGSTDDSNE